LRNSGVRDEESLKVKVAIPDLGISQTTIVDTLKSDAVDTTEPMFMRIPDCAAKGTYNVVISVTYDDGDQMTDIKKSMTIVGSDSCTPVSTNQQGTSQTLVSLPSAQDVVPGNEAVFPVLLTNSGNAAKTYSLNIQGVDSWGTVRVEPGMTQVVNAGQTNAVYVYVTPNKDTSAGQKTFVVEIKSGYESKPLTLTANVVKSSAADLGGVKKALEIGLIVFVVVLVILGLIIGYNKMKENDNNDDLDSEDGQSQTYY
jgi:uncharacterized membrane protein